LLAEPLVRSAEARPLSSWQKPGHFPCPEILALAAGLKCRAEAAVRVRNADLSADLERLTRRLAMMAHLEAMRTDRRAAGGGAARRVYVSIEDLIARLPLDEDLRDYLRWVVGHPGLNLRNAVAHGIFEQDQCHEVLGAHVLYALIALAFADLAAIAGG